MIVQWSVQYQLSPPLKTEKFYSDWWTNSIHSKLLLSNEKPLTAYEVLRNSFLISYHHYHYNTCIIVYFHIRIAFEAIIMARCTWIILQTLCAHKHNRKNKNKQTIINHCECGGLKIEKFCTVDSVSVLSVRNERERKRYNPKVYRWLSLSKNISAKIIAKDECENKKQQQPLSFAFIVFNCSAVEFLSQYISGAHNMYYLQLIYPSLLHSIACSVFESILIWSLLSFASAISGLNLKNFPLALDTIQ